MTWRMDDRLAAEVMAAAGTSLDAPLADIAAALHMWIPAGSTSKLAAMEAGLLPPGLHPARTAERILSGEQHGWTCWASATLASAVLEASGRPSRVAAELLHSTRNPVDIHALATVLDDDGRTVTVDPCHGPGLVPTDGAPVDGPASTATVADGPDGWEHTVDKPGRTLRYRLLAPACDAAAVEAFLHVSLTHTGVRRPAVSRPVRTGAVRAVQADDGTATMRRWTRAGATWRLTDEIEGQFDELARLVHLSV